MVEQVDEDGSGLIEFGEFLEIIKNSEGNESTAKIKKFFKDMSNGKVGNQNLSFQVNVQNIRRKAMMAALLQDKDDKALSDYRVYTKDEIEEGQVILGNVSKLMYEQKNRPKEEDDD